MLLSPVVAGGLHGPAANHGAKRAGGHVLNPQATQVAQPLLAVGAVQHAVAVHVDLLGEKAMVRQQHAAACDSSKLWPETLLAERYCRQSKGGVIACAIHKRHMGRM